MLSSGGSHTRTHLRSNGILFRLRDFEITHNQPLRGDFLKDITHVPNFNLEKKGKKRLWHVYSTTGPSIEALWWRDSWQYIADFHFITVLKFNLICFLRFFFVALFYGRLKLPIPRPWKSRYVGLMLFRVGTNALFQTRDDISVFANDRVCDVC